MSKDKDEDEELMQTALGTLPCYNVFLTVPYIEHVVCTVAVNALTPKDAKVKALQMIKDKKEVDDKGNYIYIGVTAKAMNLLL